MKGKAFRGLMDNKKTVSAIRALKILIILGFIAGALYIVLYPRKDQDLTIKSDTKSGTITCTVQSQTLGNSNQFEVNFYNAENIEIREIRIYRKFKTICVAKIQSANIDDYVSVNSNKLIFNSDFCDLTRELSASVFAERILGLEALLTVCLFFWIAVESLAETILGNKDNHGPIYEIRRFYKDMCKYKEYVFYAAKADLKAEVANSYLNRLWWLLEPIFNMLVYVLVFGRVMGRSVQHYGTFVFSALLMYRYFSKTVNYSVKCVRNNKDIVSKVYIPKYILLLSDMILNFYKLLFSAIILAGMMLIFKIQIGWNFVWIFPAIGIMIFLSFGEGMIFLHFGVYVDDLSHAVGILLQMLMFLSGEFYDVVASLPTPLNVVMICLNPVALFIDTMRNALLYNIAANLPLVLLWLSISLLLCYFGVHIVYKNENGYVKVI